jgi:hypothetical protein
MVKLTMAGKDVARVINNTLAKAQSFHAPTARKPFKSVCWDCGKVLKTKKQIVSGFCKKRCETAYIRRSVGRASLGCNA